MFLLQPVHPSPAMRNRSQRYAADLADWSTAEVSRRSLMLWEVEGSRSDQSLKKREADQERETTFGRALIRSGTPLSEPVTGYRASRDYSRRTSTSPPAL
ncbi:MAG: hypothetical protein ACPGXX_11605 [Planctomycetaceae bacterium]